LPLLIKKIKNRTPNRFPFFFLFHTGDFPDQEVEPF